MDTDTRPITTTNSARYYPLNWPELSENDILKEPKTDFVPEFPKSRTHAQAQHNQRPRPGCTSKYKGVRKRRNRWRAQIHYDEKTYNIGTFDDEIEAAKAYDVAALKLFGDDAYTNQMAFPEDFQEK